MSKVIIQSDPLRDRLPFDLKRRDGHARLMRRLSEGWYDIGPQVEEILVTRAAECSKLSMRRSGPAVHVWAHARHLQQTILPGWWVRLAQCHLSTDISLGPDYNDPAHRARLLRMYPEAHWDGGLDFDIRPCIGDAAALCFAILAVLQREADIKAANLNGVSGS